jgi:serine/threonine-protein kinase
LRGDFVEAEKSARELERLVQNAQAEPEHQAAARALVATYLETGKTALAADYAEAYLRRREAWLPDPFAEDFAIANDVTMRMLRALAAAGRIDKAALAVRRDAWTDEWRKRVHASLWPYLWLQAYAPAATRDEALVAIQALGVPLPAYTPKTLGIAYAGHAYLLASRLDDALPLLERAGASCMALEFPMEHTLAHLWLGRAREAKADTAGACKAYAVVLERWGKAKPRSVSADEARARSKALGCK